LLIVALRLARLEPPKQPMHVHQTSILACAFNDAEPLISCNHAQRTRTHYFEYPRWPPEYVKQLLPPQQNRAAFTCRLRDPALWRRL
jgi:hypothetical protein